MGCIDVGSRTIFARGSDGWLAVLAPIKIDDDLKAAVDALGGGVGRIVAAGARSDDAATQSWAAAFPEASVFTQAEAAVPGTLADFEAVTIKGAGTSPLDAEPSHVLAVFRWLGKKLGGAPRTDDRLRLFFHTPSKTILSGSAWWNYPTTDAPAGAAKVHTCSKVPVDETELPSARVPRRTQAWAALQSRLLWPARRSLTSQGGINVGEWVLKSGGRPPGAAVALYQEQVASALDWECETLVP